MDILNIHQEDRDTMSVQVEKLEKSMVKLTIEVSPEEFEKGLQTAYLKNRNRIHVQGFRKGKAPRALIEKMYGAGIFYEDAANEVMPDAYEKALEETKLEVVSRPAVDIVSVGKGEPFVFTVEVAVKPEVVLGQYKELEYTSAPIEVTEEEIEAEIRRTQEQNARTITVEDRAIVSGDIAVIDFEGFVDGEAFEGGKGTDYELTIGSHSFVDTFEDQLIGKNAGDEVEVHVTFPEGYQSEALAGKPAMFSVKIKSIKVKELPELDDDFASDVSDYETFAEYKESVSAGLFEKKEKAAQEEKKSALIDQAVDNASLEVADAMVEEEARQIVDNYAQRMQGQGLTMEQYLQYSGKTMEQLVEETKPNALKNIRTRLVLEKIAQEEAIEVSEEDVEKELQQMADLYKLTLDQVKEYMGSQTEMLKKDLAAQKAEELIYTSAK